MNVIAHQGYWLTEIEKNSVEAFHRAFSLDTGVKADLRDLDGEIVISHQLPMHNENLLTLDDLFIIYNNYQKPLPLAFNIKSDGLQDMIKEKVDKHGISNYFLYNLSMSEQIQALKKNLKCYGRQSEYESQAILYNDICGVWIDEFSDEWVDDGLLTEHMNNNKQLCISSPELHDREYLDAWQKYLKLPEILRRHCFLCTNMPEKARDFFS